MKLRNAAHSITSSKTASTGLSVTITVMFAALAPLLYPRVVPEPALFAIVPVGVAAWLLGMRGILVAGPAVFATNGMLMLLAGENTPLAVMFGQGFGETLVALAAGLAIGWLRDTQAQIRHQAHQTQLAQQETLEQRAVSDALRDILSEMVATLELDRVFQLILNNIWRVVPHDAANIMLIEDDGARIVAWRGYTGSDADKVAKLRFDVQALPNLNHMLETGRGVVIGDVHRDETWVHHEHGHWIHSYVAAPIRLEGRVIGFLNLDAATPGLFTAADGIRLQIFADEASIAIRNARLYAQVARHAEQLEQRVAERTTELQEAKERVEQLDQLKSKFVADVSHELRTPVANLSLYVDLLENGPRKKHREYVAVIGQQVARLSALVESILNLTRLELGRGRTDHSPVDLNRIVRETITSFTPRATAAGLSLDFTPDEALPEVMGEPSQLGQVIGNLLSNAIRYTPSGDVRLATHHDHANREAVLTVTDTGMGIGPDDMPHLFERFYRGQHAAESAIPGTGLGLAIVQEIVDLHNGSIAAQSEPGKGSVFSLRLPLAGPQG